jgi:hypothetical protein
MNYQATVYLIRKHQLDVVSHPLARCAQCEQFEQRELHVALSTKRYAFLHQTLLLGHETTKNELMIFGHWRRLVIFPLSLPRCRLLSLT